MYHTKTYKRLAKLRQASTSQRKLKTKTYCESKGEKRQPKIQQSAKIKIQGKNTTEQIHTGETHEATKLLSKTLTHKRGRSSNKGGEDRIKYTEEREDNETQVRTVNNR